VTCRKLSAESKGFALKVSFTGRDVKRTSHFPSTLGIEGGHLII